MLVVALIISIAALLVSAASVIYTRQGARAAAASTRLAARPTFRILSDGLAVADGEVAVFEIECVTADAPLDEVRLELASGRSEGLTRFVDDNGAMAARYTVGRMSGGQQKPFRCVVGGSREPHSIRVRAKSGRDEWRFSVEAVPPPHPPIFFVY